MVANAFESNTPYTQLGLRRKTLTQHQKQTNKNPKTKKPGVMIDVSDSPRYLGNRGRRIRGPVV